MNINEVNTPKIDKRHIIRDKSVLRTCLYIKLIVFYSIKTIYYNYGGITIKNY